MTYDKPTRGHIQELKLQIKGWTKGTKTIDEYIKEFITRFNQLALLGKSIDHEDQIDYILGGFPEDYKPIADQLKGREITPIVIEAHEKLLNKVAKLLTASTETAPVPVTANVSSAQTQTRQNQY